MVAKDKRLVFPTGKELFLYSKYMCCNTLLSASCCITLTYSSEVWYKWELYDVIGASLSEPHCYVANRGKRNALWCVRTRNFSTLIKIPSACDRNFYQFVVNLPIVFSSSQLLRQFAWLRISQDASHFARRNLLAELVDGRTITVNMD